MRCQTTRIKDRVNYKSRCIGHFIRIHRSEKIRFVCGGAKSVGCEIGSKSTSLLHEIWNLWTSWAENKKYSIWARRFPTQFLSPRENGQTFEFCFPHFKICVTKDSLISFQVCPFEMFLKFTVDKKSFGVEMIWVWKIDWIKHDW